MDLGCNWNHFVNELFQFTKVLWRLGTKSSDCPIFCQSRYTAWCVGGSHSSSPSVRSPLQHLNLFPDYSFATLSTPFPYQSSISPPPTLHPPPSKEICLLLLHLLLICNTQLISPCLPPSLHLSFLLLVASFFSGLSLFVPVYPHSSTRWFVLRFYI